MRKSVFAITLILLPTLVCADALPFSSQAGLDQTNRARQVQDFHGTVVILKNGQLDTMKYQHQLEEGIEVERLTSLDSPVREIVRQSGKLSCLLTESKQKIVNHQPLDRSLLFDLPKSWIALNKSYLIVDDGKQAVAGRQATVYMALPKDDLRYGRKIWIDQQTALPLKMEAYGEDGQPVAHILFSDLTIDPKVKSNSVPIDDAALHVKHIHDQQAQPFEDAPFTLKTWPQDFEIVYYIPNSLVHSSSAIAHLLLSDGFSAISVYFEDKQADSLDGAHPLGTVNSFSRSLGNKQITVLGDVPMKTVQSIAEGIALR